VLEMFAGDAGGGVTGAAAAEDGEIIMLAHGCGTAKLRGCP
jgi:hypothetical protein